MSWQPPGQLAEVNGRVRFRNLQSLQTRCIFAIYDNWEYFAELLHTSLSKSVPGNFPRSAAGVPDFLASLACPAFGPPIRSLVATQVTKHFICPLIELLCLATPVVGQIFDFPCEFQSSALAVVQENTTRLVIPWRVMRHPQTFCNMIAEKCAKSLLYLSFDSVLAGSQERDAMERRPELISGILRAATNLEELRLHDGGLLDEAMLIISESCPNLRILDVSRSGVTFLGFRRVCSGCPLLEKLYLDGCELIGLSELYFALETLKYLQILDHLKLFRALSIFAENRPDLVPLKNLRGPLRLTKALCEKSKVRCICDNFPSLADLTFLEPVSVSDLDSIKLFKSAKCITMTYNTYPDQLQYALHKNLVTLNIHFLTQALDLRLKFDFSILARFCPNLENIKFKAVEQSQIIWHPIKPNYFSKLKLVVLDHAHDFDDKMWPAYERVVLQILSSPVLEVFSLVGCSVSSSLFSELMRLKPGALSKLQALSINGLDMDGDMAIKIASSAANLRQLSVTNMDRTFGTLQSFAKANLPHVRVLDKHLVLF